jgi:hypothetical protein
MKNLYVFCYVECMDKNFDGWIILKKKIDSNSTGPLFFKEGDIWWGAVGENIGVGIKKEHGTQISLFLVDILLRTLHSLELFPLLDYMKKLVH